MEAGSLGRTVGAQAIPRCCNEVTVLTPSGLSGVSALGGRDHMAPWHGEPGHCAVLVLSR
jgi:hypothetical protein